ncbi:ankyrin repeat and MYND domain-containing protein 1 [Discoglossus pictus]
MSESRRPSAVKDFCPEEINKDEETSDIKEGGKKPDGLDGLQEQSSERVLEELVDGKGSDEPARKWSLEKATFQEDPKEALGFQAWADGSIYRGNVSMDLKLGFGQFNWVNGESYTGEFYKDHHHGKGVYTWPDGSKFTGSFYLSRKEGYGTMIFNDSRIFQGLYKADIRYGPGFETYKDGCQDVGMWLGHHLIKLCTVVPGSFSLSCYPELYQQSKEVLSNNESNSTAYKEHQVEDPFLYRYKLLLKEDHFTLPDKIYSYSSDTDHLPITPSVRSELDLHFYKDIDQPDKPSDSTSPQVQCINEMKGTYLHVYKHRNSPEHMDWDIDSIMIADRDKFGPRGSRELLAENVIDMAGAGDYETVSRILRLDLAHVDVSDSHGYTALHAATVNCHDSIINLLLDNGADVNKRNDEGLSALAICLILFYGTKSFQPNVAERNFNINKEGENKKTLDDRAFCQENGPGKLDTNSERDVNKAPALPSSYKNKLKLFLESKGFEASPGTSLSDSVLYRTSGTLSNGQDPQIAQHGGISSRSQPEDLDRRATMNLLLLRGADPNLCCIPMHALFFAVKAGDINTVRLLLEKGARTDIRLPKKYDALTPLHIAAALPGIEGVKITEMLLHAAADPNARAEDEDYIYEHDRIQCTSSVLGFPMNGSQASGLPLHQYYNKTSIVPEDGGRSPLHVACEREDNYKDARDIISLLVSHNADLNVLWSGHSPLSLAVASGNDLAVKELLANGAEPNLPLTRRVGNALCAAVNIAYEKKRTLHARVALVDRLIKAGASILMPVTIGEGKKTALGTATDYAYYKYFQDKRIAHTPYHALTPDERETFNARKRLLEHLGDLTREAVIQKENEWAKEGIIRIPELRKTAQPKRSSKEPADRTDQSLPRRDFFKYCYTCGRSVGVKLTPCSRCYCIFTCCKLCMKKSWNELHKEECQQRSGKSSSKISPNKTNTTSEKTANKLNRLKSPPNERDTPGRHPRMHASNEKLVIGENYSFN